MGGKENAGPKMTNAAGVTSGVRVKEQLGVHPRPITRTWPVLGTDDQELTDEFWFAPDDSSKVSLRKEVIQPQVLLRLPCYDLVPVTDLAVVATET